MSYCCVQHADGDLPSLAVERVKQAPGAVTRVRLEVSPLVPPSIAPSERITTCAKGVRSQLGLTDAQLTIDAGAYSCCVSRSGGGLRLQWVPSGSSAGLSSHTVLLPDGLPTDIYYFAPPMACGFGASVSGELRPLPSDAPAAANVAPVPRFPRCRLEFDWDKTNYMAYAHTAEQIRFASRVVSVCPRWGH